MTPGEDRVPVLERAVELGMNYVDNNMQSECELYGAAMAKSKTAGRDKWFIGFASWPEKITPDYEKQLTPEGMMKNIEVRLKCYHTDVLDMWRPVGATMIGVAIFLIAATTVCCSSSRSSGKMGRARTSRAARSASGKLPSV